RDTSRGRLARGEWSRKVGGERAGRFGGAPRQMSAARLRGQWDTPPKPRPAEPRPTEPGPAEESQRYFHPPAAAAPEPATPPEAPRRAASPPSIPDEDESESIFDRPFPAEPQPMPMGEGARREAGERRALV